MQAMNSEMESSPIIMNTFIHQNGRETDRQYIQQTKQKKKEKKTCTCSTVGLKE